MSETTSTEVAVRQPGIPSAADMQASVRYAEHLAHSGLLPANYRKQPANVLYAIEYGRMVGLTPMAAITGVHVIEGKPSASAALISALVRRAGHKLRVRGDARSATCQIIRSDDPEFPFEVTYTIEDARAAKLTNKEVWQKYPAAMLKARAISQCARDACEEALFGLHHTPEELGASVDDEGLPVVSVQQAAGMAREGADRLADAADLKPDTKALQRIAILVTDKFGTLKREERLEHVSRLVGRELNSSKDLTLAEAKAVIADLEALPDHIADAEVVEDGEPIGPAPNPRNGDTGKPLDPAAFVPSLQTLLIDSRGEDGPSVAASLDGLIGKATTAAELAAIWRVADEAHKDKHLTDAEFANLNLLGQAKDRELSAAAAIERSADAPTDEQYQVRDRFEGRIKRARSAEDCNDVAGALVESRDAGRITAVQFDALVALLDERERSLGKASGGGEPGWSHSHPVTQRLDEMAGAS